ncbi:hypothetical protein Clacol_008549 [Clathrus columnatus]|uniref:Uncharacterized protein n=1 Tax=Clathrus columnatus TaxID=1419009 RepID=A0AAV5AN76_9AGAM|nr:hypothetical protein Clacol_008549 [Clathrus columnatus]
MSFQILSANATTTPSLSPAELTLIAIAIENDLAPTRYIQGLTLQQETLFGEYLLILTECFHIDLMYFLAMYGSQWLQFEGWIGFVFFAAVQVISQLRLWAVYRRTDVLIIMGVIMLLGLLAMGLIEGLGYRGVAADNVTTTLLNGVIHTCGPATKTVALPRYVALFWVPPIIIETLSVILVVYKALNHYRNGGAKEWAGSRFMYSIVRYSIIYFVGVLAVYIANFIIWVQFQVPRLELLIPLTFSLPCVMGNRMLLDLRAVFYADHNLVPGQNDFNMQVVRQDTQVTVQAENFYSEFDSFFGEGKSTKNQLLSDCTMMVQTETMVKTESMALDGDIEKQLSTEISTLNEPTDF